MAQQKQNKIKQKQTNQNNRERIIRSHKNLD